MRLISKKKAARMRRFAKVRRQLMEAAGECCQARIDQVCTGRATDAHHIVQRSLGGSDDIANLIALCRSCHVFIHDSVGWSYEQGYLGRSAE